VLLLLVDAEFGTVMGEHPADKVTLLLVRAGRWLVSWKRGQ
jgi:hypothetical protein